ncbi:MAG: dockerin type I repeat-containing protein [Tepidisphaeraceae bacterium]
MSGGTLALNGGFEYVGSLGVGTFNQTGGLNTTGTLYLGGRGTFGSEPDLYNLQGGTLEATTINFNSGALSLAGGTLAYGTFTQANGTVGTNSATNILQQGILILGAGGLGNTYNLGAGTLVCPTIDVNAGGTFDYYDGQASFTGTTINQNGGSVIWNTEVLSGTDVPFYELTGIPNYNYTSGAFTVNFEELGNGSNSSYTQTYGTNAPGQELDVGMTSGDTGTYTLTGTGVLTATEYVGKGGNGTFNQTGGVNNATYLFVGASAYGLFQSGPCAYYLQAGTLAVGSGGATVSNTSTFLQTGGVLTFPTFSQSGGSVTLTSLSLGTGGNGTTYDLTGGTLSCPTITISSGGKFTQSGGSLSATTLTGNFTQNGGTATLGQITGIGNLTINGGQTALASNGGVSQVGSLTITDSGTLDIANNSLFITYGSGSDPITTIAAYIKSGYNGGNWNGPGIISSAAQVKTNGLSYGVGFADSADLHNPAGLLPGQIELKYTLLGDANLDGLVNAADFTILAANFNQPVTAWDQGDFNYDGIVNAADFTDLAANFNQADSGADVSAGDVAALDAFAAANGLTADVPEPSFMALAAFAVAAGLQRRSRRRHE